VVLQIAISVSIASLMLPLLAADGIGAWAVPLWIPGSIVVPASVLLLALGASSRLRDVNPAAILLWCAVPAIALLTLISPVWEGSQATAWTHQWLSESAELGVLVAPAQVEPASCFVRGRRLRYARPDDNRLRNRR
jgi:hypothetical protein